MYLITHCKREGSQLHWFHSALDNVLKSKKKKVVSWLYLNVTLKMYYSILLWKQDLV